ncbi:MAG: TIR domain-containing protein, partial [Rhizomicrobium sp.]
SITPYPEYWAFISYSHKDFESGKRLQRYIERYQLPRRLWGRVTAQGVAPRRLTPIFRDLDELPAADDLSAEVYAALQASKSLVVVCSPAAAASTWVSREVAQFRALHPDRPILPVLVDGEPHEAFPEALRKIHPTGEIVEPLAADLRDRGDGQTLGMLKLIAGITGIGLYELIQRDSQRRLQRAMAVTAMTVLITVLMVVSTFFALNARAEAVRERTAAEGLVEFMLTDLRTTLKGVGRLDAMTAVNQRALQYYSSQDIRQLAPESLEHHARLLHAMGEDDETRGNHAAALTKFQQARRMTAALLAAAPNNTDRIFDQAQSEFWIGYAYYAQNKFSEARQNFLTYKSLADQLVAQDPNNPKFLREAGYAEGNLCSVALEQPKNPKAAIEYCTASLAHMEAATRRVKATTEYSLDLANRHAWLADAWLANNAPRRAIGHRLIQEHILNGIMLTDPKNMDVKSFWIALQRIMAWREAKAGEQENAIARLRRAVEISDQMIAFDPSNQSWLEQKKKLLSDITENSVKKEKS